MIDRHIIGKQAVTPYVFKTDVFLNESQLVKIFRCECQPQSARAHAVIHIVVEAYLIFVVDDRFHTAPLSSLVIGSHIS